MNVVLINGGPHEKGCTNRALSEIQTELKKNGVEAEILWLGKDALAGCRACGVCAKTGRCSVNDLVNQLAPKLVEADGVIFGSPVHYAAASGNITAFLDRFFYTYGKKMAGKPGAVVVSCRRGGASAAFDQLNKYFTICNMPIVSSQYWNQVHGATAAEVEKDEEGLQTMRTLARNFAWLLSCIEAGKKAGIAFPEREAPLRTNFIR